MKNSLALRGRFTAICLTLCLSSAAVLAQLKEDPVYNIYNNETEFKASKSVTLAPGFYIPSGKTVRIFIQGVSMVPTAPFAGVPSANQNYVSTKTFKVAGLRTDQDISAPHTVAEVNQTIQYFDGLGRPLQTVVTQGSPSFQDLVTPVAYDAFGREAVKYQPYIATTGSNGSYRAAGLTEQSSYFQGQNPDLTGITNTANPFSVTVFEPSPLNRVIEQGAPGAAWQPVLGSNSGHTIKTNYATNDANEVRLWNVVSGGANGIDFYQPGTLYKIVVKDENWTGGKIGTTEEFRNFDGDVILKKVWETETKCLSTYYIYDDLGNLCYLLPPGVNENGQNITSLSENETTFDQYIYGYHYDNRNRLVEKKIPGKGWEFIVYNKLDQVVLVQDANQRTKQLKEWSFTKYDALGRVIMTGIYQNGNDRESIQNTVNIQTGVLWENRDNANVGHTGTGYTNQVLPVSGINVYHTISYYDDYDFFGNIFGQPNGINQVASTKTKGLITATSVNVLGSTKQLLTINYYDEESRVIQTKSENHLDGKDIINNVWNFVGELITSTRTHSKNGNAVSITIVTKNRYDHMARRLATIKSVNGQPEIVTSKLHYNDLGQLFKKELHSKDSTIFLQNTQYAYNERGWLKKSTSKEFSEILGYEDGVQWNGNITSQQWGVGKGPTLPNEFRYSYDVLNRLVDASSTGIVMSELITYDLMGNIITLKRDGGTANKYSYIGNKLISVDNLSGTYIYDANGNAIKDGRTGVTLTYNSLNLPASATNATKNLNIIYTFDALGSKLKKISSTNGTRDYVGEIEYQNDIIDVIHTEDGVLRNNSGIYSHEYNLTDHLGNVRYTFNQHPQTKAIQMLQEDNYYAFGLRKVVSEGGNKHLYNGKELQDELNQYDYGARFYDPVVGRWNVADPKAEKYFSYSPYVYAINNPVMFIDPNGMEINSIAGGYEFTKEDAISAFNLITGGARNVYLSITNTPNEFNHPVKNNLIRNGQWATFAGKNFYEGLDALNTIGKIADFSLQNLVIETHGGFSKNSGEAVLGITWDSNVSTKAADRIYNSELMLANGEYPGATLSDNPHIVNKLDALKALANKVETGGNLIFGACSIGAGTAGLAFGKNLNKFLGNRLDIFTAQKKVTPQYYVDKVSGQHGPWLSEMFEERFLRTKANGIQTRNVSITLSGVIGSPPVSLNKQNQRKK